MDFKKVAGKRAEHGHAPASSPSILLIDDEAALRAITREYLEGSGFLVIEAANGDAACEVLAQRRDSIDLILLDLRMPGLSGEELIDRILQLQSHPRIIVVSANSNAPVADDPGAFGAAAFLRKPFKLEALLESIRTALIRR